MKKWRVFAMGAVALATASTAAWAAGLFPGFPIVGGASYSAGLVTVPAGPTAIAPGYVIPADTALSQGQNPQTVLIPVEQLALFGAQGIAPTRNFLRNGDISVNPFQRLGGNVNVENVQNAAPLPALNIIQGTISGGPDGWSIKGGSSTAQLVYSKQTGPTSVVANQFTASYRLRRQNTSVDTAQACTHNIVQSANAIDLAGQKVVFSFWAHAGSNFSPTSSAITANLVSGTGTDEGAASMQAGTWTGQATPSTSTLNLTTTWTQYTLTGTIPATANEVGVDICFTPTNAFAGANDFLELANLQLEVVSGNVVSPSAFEHHTVQQDLAVAQAYLVVFNEAKTNVGAPIGNCVLSPLIITSVCTFNSPSVLRTTPSTGNSTPMVAGSLKLDLGGTMSLLTSPVITPSSTTMLQITMSNVAVDSPAVLQWGTVGGGQLTFSAELL